MSYIEDWDTLFMNAAYLFAMKSKDCSTHIGAVVVGLDKEVRSVGFNSFPRGIDDNIPERQERPEKYYWMAHAERNSVYNAARYGAALKNCTIYTPGMPCADCAIGIIQAGISEIVLDDAWTSEDKWAESHLRTEQMFKEAGIKIRYWNGPLLQIERFKRGETTY